MKVHLCCGDIFLTDYLNCDVQGEVIHRNNFENPPGLHYRDLDNYYKNRLVGHKQITYVDMTFDVTCFPWPFEDESVDELVMIQAIEHFEYPMAQKIINEILRILVPGGKLLIDFPDVVAGVELYCESDPEFMMRYIYCNHKNQYSIHHWGYTEKTFPKLLGFGWEYEWKEIVHHLYPTIGCVATKMK